MPAKKRKQPLGTAGWSTPFLGFARFVLFAKLPTALGGAMGRPRWRHESGHSLLISSGRIKSGWALSCTVGYDYRSRWTVLRAELPSAEPRLSVAALRNAG